MPSAIDSSAAGEGGTDAAADAVKRFNFNCIEGALALGLGFGGYYAQSVAWEPAAKGKSDEAAAHAICSRMKAIDTCMDAERARLDGGRLGTLEFRLEVGSDKVTTAAVPPRGELSHCLGIALKGAAFGAEGRLGYRYVVDTMRGRLGGRSGPAPVRVATNVKAKGPLPVEVVQRLVRAKVPSIRTCYGAWLGRNPIAEGMLVATVAIDKAGAAHTTGTKGTVKDEKMHKCVSNVLGHLTFPAGDGPTTATVRYVFNLGK